jgi:SAM-dependent methyltransferase
MAQNENMRENLREAYNKFALDREKSETQDWKIKERSKFLGLLQNEQKKNILEVGSGTGRDSKFFQDQGLETVCIDLSPAMVALCKQKGLNAYVMDMLDINFPENSFDAIYCLNSLLHLKKTEFPEVLNHLDMLLKPQGLVYIGLYGGNDFEGIYEDDSYSPKRFFSFFTDQHLKVAVSRVFDIIHFEKIIVEHGNSLHFQSIILKKKLSTTK